MKKEKKDGHLLPLFLQNGKKEKETLDETAAA